MNPAEEVLVKSRMLPTIGIPSPEADHRAIARLDPSEIELFMEEVRFSAPALFGGGERQKGNLAVIAAGPNDPATALRVLQILAPDRTANDPQEQSGTLLENAEGEWVANIESSAYTLIQHSFAMILILQVGDGQIASLKDVLKSQLGPDIAVQVVGLEGQRNPRPKGKLMSLWASVRETPGSLAQVARLLEQGSANIERLASWVSEVHGIEDRRCIINSEFTVDETVAPNDVSMALGKVFSTLDSTVPNLNNMDSPGEEFNTEAGLDPEYAVSLGRSEVPDGYRLRRGNDGSHILTFFGVDRPGLIADCAEMLAGRGINIECSSQVVLQGHAAFVALIQPASALDADELAAAVYRRLTLRGGRGIDVRVFENPIDVSRLGAAGESSGEVINIFMATPDRPGVVSDVVSAVFRAGATVTRFASMVTCPDDPQLSLRMEVLGAVELLGALEPMLSELKGPDGSVEVVPGLLDGDSPVGLMPLPSS
jgi:predicted amino acid-binding ACT domain protein